jgi:hypothetical protein
MTDQTHTTQAGYVIWRSWRDNMLAQDREVAPERMAWETLPDRDKALDAAIEAEARAPLEAENERLRAWFEGLLIYAPPEVMKDEFAYDRLLQNVHAAARAALEPSEVIEVSEPLLNGYGRAVCVCGNTVLPENWANHLLSQTGAHGRPDVPLITPAPEPTP